MGHCTLLAEYVKQGLETAGLTVDIIVIGAPPFDYTALHDADIIILGCPTHFGGVSAPFKAFQDGTGPIWAEQKWSGKIAAGFTTSEWPSGDKLQTIIQLALFAAQHGMHWATLGAPPPKRDRATGPNRLGGWLGLMSQAIGSAGSPRIPELDVAAARFFGERIGELTGAITANRPTTSMTKQPAAPSA